MTTETTTPGFSVSHRGAQILAGARRISEEHHRRLDAWNWSRLPASSSSSPCTLFPRRPPSSPALGDGGLSDGRRNAARGRAGCLPAAGYRVPRGQRTRVSSHQGFNVKVQDRNVPLARTHLGTCIIHAMPALLLLPVDDDDSSDRGISPAHHSGRRAVPNSSAEYPCAPE